MHKTRARAIALAALALCGVATAAVRDDVDRFGARRDRNAARELGSTLPRNAAGALDVPRLIVEIRAALTRGARDIRFRDATLSPSEARTLRELASRFGLESVRIREEGRHVRVEFRDVDDNKDRERADVRKDARDDTITRVELRDRSPRPDQVQKPERVERADRPERQDRGDRGDRPDRSGRH
jgi:hypothetical protein